MLRRVVSITMSLLLTVPLWAGTTPVGTVASGSGVTLSGTLAAPGNTIFSGDTLAVRATGNALLLINGGSRVVVGSSSVARIVREGSSYDLELTQGGVGFSSSSRSLVEGRVADVTFRPQNPAQPSVAYISFKDSTHPVFYADKGSWLLTTARDGHTLVLGPGKKIEGMVAADNQEQNNDQQPPNKHKRKWAVFWIGGIAAGTATGFGLAFGQSECKSPLQGPGCTLSPVVPNTGGTVIPQ